MNIARFPRLLLLLFAASLALNIWQFQRPRPSDADSPLQPVSHSIARNHAATGSASGNAPLAKSEETPDAGTSAKSAAAKPSPEQQSEDELIFGASGTDKL